MDWGIGRVFENDVNQAGETCGFRAAYNMTIASSSDDSLLSCKTLANFQPVFLSPMGVVSMSIYVGTFIPRLNRALAFY